MTSHLGDTKFCPVLHDMLTTGSIRLPNGEDVPIRGTSTVNNIRTIRRLLQTRKPTSTLEIGLAFGASALTILATQNDLHEGATFQHTAIDPYQTTVWKSAAIHAIETAGLNAQFTHIEEDSALALPSLCSDKNTYGLIYVDGSHIFEDVFVDFCYCARLLAMDGTLLFDDCTDKHVRKVLRFIDKNYTGILKRENVVSSPTIKQRVGHAVGRQQLVAYRKIGTPPREWNSPFSNF